MVLGQLRLVLCMAVYTTLQNVAVGEYLSRRSNCYRLPADAVARTAWCKTAA
jgi:hypothetical protein